MSSVIKCCKDCTERQRACWGSCPEYLEARKQFEEEKQVRKRQRDTDMAINDIRRKTKRYKGDNRSNDN